MTQHIEFMGRIYDLESDALQHALSTVSDLRANRPTCRCQREPIDMYVSKVNGRYLVKRMPNTGHLHHAACDSFEEPAVLGGLSDVDGRAILHDAETGAVTLRLGFSLSKNNSSHVAMTPPAPPETAKSGNTRLTLRGTLDYLWDAAQLNRWRPAMRGKRNWAVVHKYTRRAMDAVTAKRMPLAQLLYVPEPFASTRAPEIRQRADAALVRCAYQRSGKQSLMLVLAEVKGSHEARSGAMTYQLKHVPFIDFFAPASLQSRLVRVYERELALWNANPDCRMILLGLVAQNAALTYEFAEVALMVVDEGWIPVESQHQVVLLARLAAADRSFIRGMRFSAGPDARFADVLLTDTFPPAAVYLTQGTEDEGALTRLMLECEDHGLNAHFVRASDALHAPLPPVQGSAAQGWTGDAG